jgi:ferredoxin-NADP reductase
VTEHPAPALPARSRLSLRGATIVLLFALVVGAGGGAVLRALHGGGTAAARPALPTLHGQAVWPVGARRAPNFTLRDQSPRRIVFIGGGAGMAPILCLLRSLQERGIERDAVYYYGARTETDLFHREELEALANELPSFRYVPALSHAEWDGEAGLITDVVERLEQDLKDVDAYVCGPPPMVEAAQGLLMAKGVPESRIYFDKFTTTETEETSRT